MLRLTLLFFCSLAFAQLDSNSVTVTASRTSTAQADLVLFSVTVNGDPETSISDVLSAIQPLGATVSNLISVGTYSSGVSAQTNVSWAFSISAALTNLKDTVSTLNRLQKTIGETNRNLHLSLSYSLDGSAYSVQAQQAQPCVVADLVSDARAKAGSMANAAGRTLSGILAVSGATTPPANASTTVPNCSVTVKFALLGN